MYSCKECNYKTNRKDTYSRHMTSSKHMRKIAADAKNVCENVVFGGENTVISGENTVISCENTVISGENTVISGENAVSTCENNISNETKYVCYKCNKSYNSNRYLKDHERRCKGIDSFTCPRCMKRFTDSGNKSRHCKKNTCKPVSIFEADNIKSMINNNDSYNNNCHNTTNNTINNNNTTNIYINDYGKERKDYLLEYDNFYDIIRVPNNSILVKYLKCKNFNPHFPENRCLKYENKRFKFKENDRWELINATALKDKLFFDCGSEVLNVFGTHQDKLRHNFNNIDHYEAVKKKSDFFQLQIEGSDKEIKNRMLDVIKDDT